MRVSESKRSRVAGLVGGSVLAAAALVPVVGPAGVAWALPSSLSIVGHGSGHGRGMGQWGAVGYSQSPYNWTHAQILSHYYGGTQAASTTVTALDVSLSELDGAASIVVSSPSGHLVINGQTTTDTSATIRRAATDQSVAASSGDIDVNGSWPNKSSVRAFKGTIVVKGTSGSYATQVWNRVGLTDYVEGVVPRESEGAWPTEALAAQAVAVRSYAVRYTGGGANPICDWAACQVYGGDPASFLGSYLAHSNGAVTETGNEVLECGSDTSCGSPTTVAYTEYSSSTGGWTAGGAFPAVVDSGDATSSNPDHSWSASVSTASVQAAFRAVGTLQSITVTSRNGDGDLGGRVLQMVLVGSAGRQTVTGDQFAAAVGLMSDWFAITNASPPPAGSDGGYWVVSSAGVVYPFGDAPSYGDMSGYTLNGAVIGMAPTGNGAGYWLVGSDGGVFSFGNARFYGSTGGAPLNAPVLGMASTADSGGYWMVASDGGIFSFGDAHFYGSTGGTTLTKPVVAMARTGDGKGYWMVASDGGIFAFGDARFYGSAASFHLAAPIVGMVPTADGKGYWLVASDGGIFAFGDAGFVGSLGGSGVTDVVSVTATPDNRGYLLVTRGGTVYAFGDATYYGDPASSVSGWSGSAVGVFARA